MSVLEISDQEFTSFQRFIYDAAGISLSAGKKALVSGRLSKRLTTHQLNSFSAYFKLLCSGAAPAEVQTAVDLLTTNETYFFREPKHFELLRQVAAAARAPGAVRTGPLRVWSAASSTGEEAYSIAMVLEDVMPGDWEVFGSDINTSVLQKARLAHYPVERTTHIPAPYLRRFCLRGVNEQHGTLLIDRALRERVQFSQINLNRPLPQLGSFDLIFLRNVMIYFDAETKRQVVARVLSQLRPGGYFIIGHSESLHDISTAVVGQAPSIYRKP